MPTIKRTCANKIITRALEVQPRAFTAILPINADDCLPAADLGELQRLLQQHTDAFIVFNQHPDAITRIKSLQTPDQQLWLEIRQETRGVLGLEARYKSAGPGDTLELVYQ